MKTIIIAISILISCTSLYAQQIPITENHLVNKYTLSSAYAGVYKPNYLFTSYRHDWIGVKGGPKTLSLSYSTNPWEKMGIGAKLVFDKTDIFQQTQLMGTYAYKLQFFEDHYAYFGISVGFYRSSIDMSEYLLDPKYMSDPAVVFGHNNSKPRFTGDYSLVYAYKGIEAGVVFSNIVFGNVKFQDVDLTYEPLANYQLHATYMHEINYNWSVEPLIILRGGKNISSQVEIAAMTTYKNQFWGGLMFRTQKIFGMGIGARIYNGILFNYSYNVNYGLTTNHFQNHEVILGFDLSNIFKKTLIN